MAAPKAEIQRLPDFKYNTSDKVYDWTLPGVDKGKNNFPTKAIELVQQSGLASRGLEVIGKYLAGDGLRIVFQDANAKDEVLQRIVDRINDKHLGQVCDGFAYFPSVAINTLHDGSGVIRDIQAMDNSSVRIGMYDESMNFDYVVTCGDWPNAKTKFDPQKPEQFKRKYSRFVNKEKAAAEVLYFHDQQMIHHGQMLFEQMKGPGDFIYATPVWWSGANAIYLDVSVFKFQIDQIDNNFNATVIVYITKNLDGAASEGSGYSSALEEMKGNLTKKFAKRTDKGGDGSTFILVDGVSDKDGKPIEVATISNNANHDMFLATYEKAHQSVLEALGVPGALITAASVSGIGNADAVTNEVLKFNDGLLKSQKFIAYQFEKILKNWEGVTNTDFKLEIVANNPYSKLPDIVLNRLSDVELFGMFGLSHIIEERAAKAVTI